ncbi:hypothetical protein B0T16DRAFT_501584 [Cercophora newfieldiana]|uniref:Uncharacterized protein n=1 Tax=Cercophora newfieldiana TaxID=92897 RepID=A0AA39YQR8_9PEZI|nr:hypothetical protein B0T16DRAFT_501584 [Cercophora newfieldiana]
MAFLQERIHSAATEYRKLTDIITSTNHAPSQLSQQQDLISALQTDITESDALVASAEARRLAEQSDHTKYQNSTFRRFAHKASGQSSKYSAKAAKEESEYLAAIQSEHTEKQRNAALRSHLAAAQSLSDSLAPAASQHAQAQSDLDSLLSSVFDGPTPSHPDEDSAERDVSLALSAHRAAQDDLNSESSALAYLKTAQLAMRGAVAAAKEAVSIMVHLDAVSDRSTSDKKARAALTAIETQLLSARVSYLQAQRVKPQLEDVPQLEVNQKGIMRAMYFTTQNPFRREETEVETMVKALSDRVWEVGMFVKRRVEEGGVKEEVLKGRVKEREGELKTAKDRLRRVRENVFESMVEGKV